MVSRIIDNLKNLFDSAASNADAIAILSTQMNRFVDLVKLFSWLNKLLQPVGGGSSSSTSSSSVAIFGTSSILVSFIRIRLEFTCEKNNRKIINSL